MTSFDRTLAALIRATGLFQILTGVLFWFGWVRPYIPVHMLVGAAFVISLWILAARGLGAARGFASFVLVWGALVLVFGMTQTRILVGHPHWIVEVLHLAVGGAAMGFADGLSKRMKRVAGRAPHAGEADPTPASTE